MQNKYIKIIYKNYKHALIFIVVIILCIVGYVVLESKGNPSKQTVSTSAERDRKNTQIVTNKDTAPQRETKGTSNPTTVVPTSGSTPAIQNASLRIDSFGQSGGQVSASASTDATQLGTCYYIFSNANAQPVNRSSASAQKDGRQGCSTTVNEVEFSTTGMWHLVVQFNTGSQKLETAQNVTIN